MKGIFCINICNLACGMAFKHNLTTSMTTYFEKIGDKGLKN